jgi:glycosyltransferase involved in cell wall biosynthesis
MKITYLAPSIIPSRSANSIHVMKMCQAFAKNGHEVTLLAPGNNKNKEKEFAGDLYELYGVERVFEIKRFVSPDKDYLHGLWCAFVISKLKPDIVFGRHFPGSFFAAKTGTDVVFESHAPMFENSILGKHLFRNMTKSKRLKKMIVITHALKKHIEEKYPVLTGRVEVAPDAADPIPENTIAVTLPNSGHRLQVGYTGHLYKGRGIDLIIAMAKQCIWADFHLVGGMEDDIRYWREVAKDCANIVFHGYKTPAEMPAYTLAFDVLLAPYGTCVAVVGGAGNTVDWMSPLKLFEYMAAGKAIITSDLPVLNEVMTNGQICLMCQPGNYEDWCKALEKLRNDKALRLQLGRQAKNDFLKKHTWQSRAKRLIDIIS